LLEGFFELFNFLMKGVTLKTSFAPSGLANVESDQTGDEENREHDQNRTQQGITLWHFNQAYPVLLLAINFLGGDGVQLDVS
jgi:hypothetical protein